MAIFDSTYLFGSVLESFRKHFQMETELHVILFPWFLYPFNQIAITGKTIEKNKAMIFVTPPTKLVWKDVKNLWQLGNEISQQFIPD